jgi:hypothetical protein
MSYLYALLQSLHSPWLIALGVVTLLPAAIALSRRGSRPAGYAETVLRAAAAGWPVVALLPLSALGLAFAYLLAPQFADHVEPQVAAVSWIACQGGDAYPPAGAPARYAILYGPLLYIAHCGVYALLGPGLAAAKTLGVVSFAAVLAGAAWLGHALLRGRLPALVFAAFVATVAIMFGAAAFWVRSDPELILLALLSCFAPLIRRKLAAAAGLGALMGLAFALKATGPFYLLPMLAWCVWPGPRRLAGLAAAAAGFIALLAMTVALNPAQYMQYLELLAAASGRPMVYSILDRSVPAFLFVSLPLVCAALSGRRARDSAAGAAALAYLLSGIVVVYLSGKQGGGWHHVAPLAPVSLVLAALIAREARDDGGRAARAVLALALGCAVLALPHAAWRAHGLGAYLAEAPRYRAMEDALRAIVAGHPGAAIQMGYTDKARYAASFLRPILVYAGNPYTLDAAAEMDYVVVGQAMPDAAVAALARCAGTYWVLPAKGTPFSLPSSYDGQALFTDAFRETFLARYAVTGRFGEYAVYGCRSSASK